MDSLLNFLLAEFSRPSPNIIIKKMLYHHQTVFVEPWVTSPWQKSAVHWFGIGILYGRWKNFQKHAGPTDWKRKRVYISINDIEAVQPSLRKFNQLPFLSVNWNIPHGLKSIGMLVFSLTSNKKIITVFFVQFILNFLRFFHFHNLNKFRN